jgi:hypothetical protein
VDSGLQGTADHVNGRETGAPWRVARVVIQRISHQASQFGPLLRSHPPQCHLIRQDHLRQQRRGPLRHQPGRPARRPAQVFPFCLPGQADQHILGQGNPAPQPAGTGTALPLTTEAARRREAPPSRRPGRGHGGAPRAALHRLTGAPSRCISSPAGAPRTGGRPVLADAVRHGRQYDPDRQRRPAVAPADRLHRHRLRTR